MKTNATSVADARQARSPTEQNAQGDVLTADANLETAQINLAYTDIMRRSPAGSAAPPYHGQCRRARQRRADDDRQPGPDVRRLSRSASASSCTSRAAPGRAATT